MRNHNIEEHHQLQIKTGNWISVIVIILTCLCMPQTSVSSLNSPAGPTTDPNYALQFDGSDDFVRVLDIGNFDFDTTFTVELWYKPDSVAGTGLFKGLVSGRLDDQPNSGGGWIVSMPKADHSQWGLSVCTPTCNATRTDPGSLVVGEWHHLAATYDGSTIQSYQDGAPVDSVAHSGNVTDINYLFIGALFGAVTGTIDEVRIWNIARTQQEILATLLSRLQGDEAGLVAYWPFDDGSGQFATDATGQGQAARLGPTAGIDAEDPVWVVSDSPIIPPAFQLFPPVAGLDTSIGISSVFGDVFNCGWSPGETVEVRWDRPEAQLATFLVDDSGCFEGMFPLDSGERIPGSEPGPHEISVTGSVTGLVAVPFEQTVQQLILSPSQGPSDREVAVSGCGWDGESAISVLLQPTNEPLGKPLAVDPVTGCVADTLPIPREKDGFLTMLGVSDSGFVTGTAYWVQSGKVFLTPNEGPAGARIPLAGCQWFPEEQIDFAFAADGVIFDTWGSNTSGCISSNGPTMPALQIPAGALLGPRIIQATGADSGQVVNVPFTVIERSLVFDPDNGLPGDTIAVSGCGWVGNNLVTIEWGYPDTNNLPIRWSATVDAATGCFGQAGDLSIVVPDNTISGEVVQTATGDTVGSITASFFVNHAGYIEIPSPDGVAGGSKLVNIFDAIVGETLIFKWDSEVDGFDGVGAAVPDFSYDITLPLDASVGAHMVTAEGTKGFNDQASVNILDTAQISVLNSGDIYSGDPIQVMGAQWAAEEVISFELHKDLVVTAIADTVTVAAGSLEFNETLTLPADLLSGIYTLVAQGDKGRDAETTLSIIAGALPDFSLTAAYAAPPPDLDGALRRGEWNYDQKASFSNGFISARSDETRLYVLLDVLADTGNDTPGIDNFWLSFDIWNDQQIDSGWDLNFRLDNSGDFILEEYDGPDSFSPRNSTFLRSAYAAGFGCSLYDGSLGITFVGFAPKITCNMHRIWEIAIDLQSIGAVPGGTVRLGLRIQSGNPGFSEDKPTGFTSDFSELGAITLAPSQLDPDPPSGVVAGIGSNGFEVEVTQAIQDVNNSLNLVADKDTAVRVYPEVQDESLVRVFLFGANNGQDLPGSPLVTLATIPATVDRESFNHTANFPLPASWTVEGIRQFTAIAENLDGTNPQAIGESAQFHTRRVPEIWSFPFNLGSIANPILPASADMTAQEKVLERMYPTPSVTFVRRSWKETGITGQGETVVADLARNRIEDKSLPRPEQTTVIPKAPAAASTSLALNRKSKPHVYYYVNQKLSLIYEVTTSGPASVPGPITVNDDKKTVTCPAVSSIGNEDGNLDEDEQLNCKASHTVVQADFDSGQFTSTATAFGDNGNAMSNSSPLQVVPGIDFESMKKVLNFYWTMLSFSKALSVGSPPLPDMLYGFKTTGDPRRVGTSDPVYYGGGGHVVVGQADGKNFNSTTMIHEVNHNLDRSSSGTWGRHVADPENIDDTGWGCGAGGPDLGWPYDGNDSIQEVGFDTTRPWSDSSSSHDTVTPASRDDFMSYCWTKDRTPIQWISPYRWQAMFAKFTPPSSADLRAALVVQPVYYISGQLNQDGSGSLDPIQVMPGSLSTDIAPGEYSIEVQDINDTVLFVAPFVATFVDVEGVELETVYFSYQLPAQENVARILLKHNGDILDTIEPSANPPTAELLAPVNGDNWNDQAIIEWTANDLDGDPLQFTILYSPDDGNNWYPVASQLTGSQYAVDVDLLPGGSGGKILLIVSDGFHTVLVQSAGTFTVPHPSPMVVIDSPADGQVFVIDEWINLAGVASDAAGSSPESFTYVWSVNGEIADVGSETGILLEEGDYTVTLTAYDELDNFGEASVSIHVSPSQPPNTPSNPTPADAATAVLLNTSLSWTGGDPEGDPVTYDVYLEAGNGSPGILICQDVSVSFCTPPADLLPSTHYYWRVIARDDINQTREGPTWEFDTIDGAPEEIIFTDGFEF
jgi:hypothetical protein